MSVDVQKQNARTHWHHGIATAHRRKLRQLRAITNIIASNQSLNTLLKAQVDEDEASPPADDEETAFLDLNDLSHGRCFDETSLPHPSIPHHDDPIYASKPYSTSPQPSDALSTARGPDTHATEAALTTPAVDDAASLITATAGPGSLLDSSLVAEVKNGATYSDPAGETVVRPSDAVPPTAEDEAHFSAATKELLHSQPGDRPAKTVHLPPEHVQEERLRQRQEAVSGERQKSDTERSSRAPHLHTQADLASSPSSTVGAYSATTPQPPQDSPDTLPDSESSTEEVVLPPKDLQPSPEEQRAQEQHDRILAAQKDIARREARAEATPDEQLNWEAREASAREKEESEARDAVHESQLAALNVEDESATEKPAGPAQTDTLARPPRQPDGEVDDISPSRPSGQQEPLDDGDTITVTPRIRSAQIDGASRQLESSYQQPPTLAEAVDERPSNTVTPRALRQDSTFEPISPRTVRRPLESQDGFAASPHTPSRTANQVSQRSPQRPGLTIDELASLKGAAVDPDRDYLEPLFRIQAHDSPNSHTRALPELVKSASKYLSTEDQFTFLHERMDHRILRRIYQLQNANKWSLRQMEKAKEPEPPITHIDHLMKEMKWMRKDFKAERKMKKSVCAWLAARCADWVTADAASRKAMQVRVKPHGSPESTERVSELEASGDSAPEDDATPTTPKDDSISALQLIVTPELSEVVGNLQKTGQLRTAIRSLPIVGVRAPERKPTSLPLCAVSKFVEGKILPQATGPLRKRSRFEYEDEEELVEREPELKRIRKDEELAPEKADVALFHPDNKHIRDRLRANTAFRPPSEIGMPATTFYEFRNGSQWIWEDDQKLRKLAKEYAFNWTLIADEMALPTRYKSAAERRTPWECFERWVELETLPAEMRKTMYFKTWFQRLEQSQQAADRRYQAQVAAIQAQAQNGQQVHIPQRRRTVPTRVEKRKNTRYIWLIDAMRKLTKKREQQAFKNAENARAAAQRKTHADNNPPQRPMLTPQELSKRRQDRDNEIKALQQQQRENLLRAQRKQYERARNAQQAQMAGMAGQQVPNVANVAAQQQQMQVNGQQHVNMNGQLPQQPRPPLPMATKNGLLAVPQINAQGLPQVPLPHASQTATQQQLYRLAQQAQQAQQQRNVQYAQYNMPNGHMASPGSNMTNQQQLQHNQALLAQMAAQQAHGQGQISAQAVANHQPSATPSMPPPPTPQTQPQQLSSGVTPAINIIKTQLRQRHPHVSEEQLTQMATTELLKQSRAQTVQAQSTHQVRQNAMNAAAGIAPQNHHNGIHQTYDQNQAAFQSNGQMPNGASPYMNGDAGAGSSQSPSINGVTHSPQAAAAYANQVRARQFQQLQRFQMQQQQQQTQQSPIATHAQLAQMGGSPAMTHASPNMTPASPAMAYAQMSANAGLNGTNSARPPSRNQAPGMLRMSSSSNGVPGMEGMQNVHTPGGTVVSSSPRLVQAGVQMVGR